MGAIATSNPDASKEVRTQTVGTPMSGVQIANGITQLREQNGGMHAWSQNQQCLHLGLGKNNQVARLFIHWHSGQVQELTNIAADQVLRVIEPRTYDKNNLEKRGASDVVSIQQENNSFIEYPSILLLKKKIALIISILLLVSLLRSIVVFVE
jgi:hypothetical protein